VLDPRPQAGSPANSGYPDPSLADPWFTSVTYAGAFSSDSTSESGTWLCGWTALAQYGFLVQRRGDLTGDNVISPADAVAQSSVVYLGNPAHLCRADSNCDGTITAADYVNVLNNVYLGTPLPCL
jgi:hypothetical protein